MRSTRQRLNFTVTSYLLISPLILLGSKRKARQQNPPVNIPAKCAFSALSMLEQGARLSCPQDICLRDDGFTHLPPPDWKERNRIGPRA